MLRHMTDDVVALMIRQAIGGDPDGDLVDRRRGRHLATTRRSSSMAAMLDGRVDRLDRAVAVATSRRDRQVVAIARARLVDDDDLVDALARDHLVDHPDSLIVAWIASAAAVRARPQDGL